MGQKPEPWTPTAAPRHLMTACITTAYSHFLRRKVFKINSQRNHREWSLESLYNQAAHLWQWTAWPGTDGQDSLTQRTSYQWCFLSWPPFKTFFFFFLFLKFLFFLFLKVKFIRVAKDYIVWSVQFWYILHYVLKTEHLILSKCGQGWQSPNDNGGDCLDFLWSQRRWQKAKCKWLHLILKIAWNKILYLTYCIDWPI